MKGFRPRASFLFLEHTQLMPTSGPRRLQFPPPGTTLGQSQSRPAPSQQQLGEAPLPPDRSSREAPAPTLSDPLHILSAASFRDISFASTPN